MRSSESLDASEVQELTGLEAGLDGSETTDEETWEIFRVHCPDCRQPIALLADEDVLPEHALCATPWNPFGLSVCAGSGRSVEDAGPVQDVLDGGEREVAAALLTLPAGLDWRTQPFSHVGGPGSRPMRMPRQA
ncbi:hypothetical protein [Wenjunlia tyrosinilytica]|uniref:Uncharacterized protein n=1 Tax=Wenjunlia tyrosinilytica TaxID=1544741 RepID=A0A918DWC7_9ACTN|nr:hypothetical protein [Wenjunlia tyrosinilytica]GGO87530.1 hypothetical protein GCM10012280_26190 [Wenjunlia tyrosinilytica]